MPLYETKIEDQKNYKMVNILLHAKLQTFSTHKKFHFAVNNNDSNNNNNNNNNDSNNNNNNNNNDSNNNNNNNNNDSK